MVVEEIAVQPGRISYFDWLRVLAVAGVVVFHAVLPFANVGWWVSNISGSDVLKAIVPLVDAFGLALLFLLAGASARFALQKRSTRAFLKERSVRLVVPFVVGFPLVVLPVGYVTAIASGLVSGSFLDFLAAWPGLTLKWLQTIGLSPRIFDIDQHLWFLGYLFVFVLLGIPAFRFLSSARGRSWVGAIAAGARVPGATLLVAVPMAVAVLALYRLAPVVHDWWSFSFYGITFLAGYVIYSDQRLTAAARRDFPIALAVALLASAVLIASQFTAWSLGYQSGPRGVDATYFLMLTLYVISGWSWTLALVGVGMRAKFMQRPLAGHISEMAMPAYILHMPIVVTATFFVVELPFDLFAKIAISLAVSAGGTIAVAAIATHIGILRRILGLHPAPRGRMTVALPRATVQGGS
jgi:peptidoglycan/LPS O-acetylase OafA/YrhL